MGGGTAEVMLTMSSCLLKPKGPSGCSRLFSLLSYTFKIFHD